MGGWLNGLSLQRYDDVDILQSTGLLDKNGVEIFEGDLFKRPVTINNERFGTWSINEVRIHNGFPIAIYVVSEKGQIIPRGYSACLLFEADGDTDMKLLLFSTEPYQFFDIEIIGNVYDNPELCDLTTEGD